MTQHNEKTLKNFESWAVELGYNLEKTAAMRTENPYATPQTWAAYEAWCASAQSREPVRSRDPELFCPGSATLLWTSKN